MLIEQVAKLTPLERFLYWIKERHSIYLRKQRGKPKPWTDDEILRSYRFCNVRRMDDKVSQWLLNEWYLPNFDHSNSLVACLLARHFNKPETLAEIGFPHKWNPKRVKAIAKRQAHPFSGAYIISGGSGSGNRGIRKGIDKVSLVIDYVINPLVKSHPVLDTNSVQKCVELLVTYRGMGSFMAGQVVADLRHATSGTWRDAKSWAAKGPGSVRGMNRLLGRPIKSGITQSQFVKELNHTVLLGSRALSKISNRMEAIDWQNCLCEYDKYERVLWGEGRPKRWYNGNP